VQNLQGIFNNEKAFVEKLTPSFAFIIDHLLKCEVLTDIDFLSKSSTASGTISYVLSDFLKPTAINSEGVKSASASV